MLEQLQNRLVQLPAITSLQDALHQQASEIDYTNVLLRVAPLIIAARVPVIAALVQQQTHPVLYVVPNTEVAMRVADGLRQWLTPEQVYVYPANDTLTYEYVAPSTEVRAQRLRVLQVLARVAQIQGSVSAPPVVVAPLRAVLQTTLTPEELTYATTNLRINTILGQDALLRRWLELGYQTAPMVAQPGDLARRGGIVDIWPTSDDQPLRIEWFGDEIDSLRRFDPETQRSTEPLQQIRIGPPDEIPFWRAQQALERVHSLELSNLRPEALDEWQGLIQRLTDSDITQNDNAETWAFLAPFFHLDTHGSQPDASLFGHLPSGAAVFFSDALLLSQAAAEMHTQAEERRANLVATGELAANFPRPYLTWAELLAQATALVLIDLTNTEDLSDLQSVDVADQIIDIALYSKPGVPLFATAELFGGQLRRLVRDIVRRLRMGEDVVVVTPQVARIQELVQEAQNHQPADEQPGVYPHLPTDDDTELLETTQVRQPGTLTMVHGALDAGWRLPSQNLTLYTDSEIFGWRQRRSFAERQRRKERTADERAAFLRGLQTGDFVVHIEHGIAVYEGLLRRTVANVEREYLSLRYAGGDRLYVPVDQADRVARYIGTGDATPQLTRLGTQEWERAKRKARAAVRDLADDLIKIYAQRQENTGHAFASDNDWQRELEDAFPYIETEDQLRALGEIKQDMESSHPMDRLMCGDVGFGKTEVALRAAFKAVQDGKQVAILVPTTVLAQQHNTTFTRRMSAFPVRIEMLSRFRTTREQNAVLQQLARGQVDIIIGTHRLLSKDVHFKDLGLLIVDEEQRFGVRHKERLKQLRAEVDVLTLTATPIPRTLHMTLAGIRDMSLIETPPEDRVPIKTYVVPYDDNLVRDAIRRELDRGGQIYYVHNRVHSIYHVANRLRKLVPEAAIGVGHGQLDERDLEKIMIEFVDGTYDVLVATTIIENGLDVPNTNTIIIDDATNYGLAQLYQLRGRVGRSAVRAYAYLLYRQERAMTEEAQQRLQAIQEATELGAGFRIAMRDLEIRGAGNLLGAEQSGHIAAVGFDLYSRLLEQAVQQLKTGTLLAEPAATTSDGAAAQATSQNGKAKRTRGVVVNEKVLVSPLVTLDLPLTAYLPTDYVPDETVRLDVYQRMVAAQDSAEVQALRQEMLDRFGEIPTPAAHLLTWLQIKALALQAGVASIVSTDDEFVVRLPLIAPGQRNELERTFRGDKQIRVGPQFIRLDRRRTKDDQAWIDQLLSILEVLARSVKTDRATLKR